MKKWDDICDCCGLCCYERALHDNTLFLDLSAPCRFLDKETKRCTVFYERFKKCNRCGRVTPFIVCFTNLLPARCTYYKWAKKHHIRFRRDIETVFVNGGDLSYKNRQE